MSRAIYHLDRALACVAYALCALGGLGLVLAVLATCVSALGKLGSRVLKAIYGASDVPPALSWIVPMPGEDELVGFAVGLALFAALPLVTLRRGHIRVDLLKPAFGRRLNQGLDLLGDGLLLLLAYLLMRQQWNLIFKPARASRGQEPLLDLIWVGDWAQIWGTRFIDNQQTQVMGLKYWPWHVWGEVCVSVFFLTALFVFARAVVGLFAPHAAASSFHDAAA